MMEPHGARGKDEIQSKLNELSGKWEELQTRLHDKIAESEKCEAVTALNNEVETVSRRLDELAASTEDLTAATYDTANVLEHRESYEVRRFKRTVHNHTLNFAMLLHKPTFRTSCLALLLQHKLQEKLSSVTQLEVSRNVFVAASVARSRIEFHIAQIYKQIMRCLGVLHKATFPSTFLQSQQQKKYIFISMARQVAWNIALIALQCLYHAENWFPIIKRSVPCFLFNFVPAKEKMFRSFLVVTILFLFVGFLNYYFEFLFDRKCFYTL